MKIEVLFPELVVLFGESANVKYLQKCVPEAEVVYTRNHEKPAFTEGDVDFVYVGSMSEEYYEIALETLLPYKEALEKYIEEGKVFLATGNAIDLFGKEIRWGEKTIPALGLFDFYSVVDRDNRHNSWFLGEFEDMKIVSNRSIFSRQYGGEDTPFIKKLGGFGMNDSTDIEGVRKNNFYATSLLGPFLITNPLFTKHILKEMGTDGTLWNEDIIMEAYSNRLAKFTKPNPRFVMNDHG